MVNKTCPKCNKEYSTKNKNQICCSISCANLKNGKPLRKCCICNKEYKHYSKITCSKECFHKLLSIKVKEIHSLETKSEKKRRNSNIQKALSIKITPELKESIENVLKLTYIKDENLIMKRTSSGYSYKALDNYKKEFPEDFLKLKENMFPGPLSKVVQNLSKEQFDELLIDITKYSYKYNLNKWKLNEKTIKRLFNFYIKTDDFLDKKETFIEKQIRRILDENHIQYDREKYLVHRKYRYDFKIKNTSKIIEVNGDFWHCNPKIYGTDPTLWKNVQKEAYIRHSQKLEYCKLNNYEVLEIWESEIDENLDSVKNKIIEYAKN